MVRHHDKDRERDMGRHHGRDRERERDVGRRPSDRERERRRSCSPSNSSPRDRRDRRAIKREDVHNVKEEPGLHIKEEEKRYIKEEDRPKIFQPWSQVCIPVSERMYMRVFLYSYVCVCVLPLLEGDCVFFVSYVC
jgi:hypothetical protein